MHEWRILFHQLMVHIRQNTRKTNNQQLNQLKLQWLSDSFRVHQIRFRPDAAGGAYSALPDPLDDWFRTWGKLSKLGNGAFWFG